MHQGPELNTGGFAQGSVFYPRIVRSETRVEIVNMEMMKIKTVGVVKMKLKCASRS